MTSPCSVPLKPTIPPVTQDPNIPPPLPPNPLDLALPSPPCSLQASVPPPPPLPPPPSTVEVVPPHVYGLEKSQLLKEALEKAGPVPKGREDVKRLLKLHKDRFRNDLQWILFCADLPSLIQEGPQCGLVALWMAGSLLSTPDTDSVSLERLVRVAMERGYTAQGEMFSVADMAKLAQETLDCQTELLCGGLGGPNRHRVLQHLITGHPLLIPYDEDFNHEPCQKKGHKAHWAVSAGVLIGVQSVPIFGYTEDSELPGLFHPVPGTPYQSPSLPEESSPGPPMDGCTWYLLVGYRLASVARSCCLDHGSGAISWGWSTCLEVPSITIRVPQLHPLCDICSPTCILRAFGLLLEISHTITPSVASQA